MISFFKKWPILFCSLSLRHLSLLSASQYPLLLGITKKILLQCDHQFDDSLSPTRLQTPPGQEPYSTYFCGSST